MTLRLAELALALLAVGLFVGCSRGRVDEGPERAAPAEAAAPATTEGGASAVGRRGADGSVGDGGSIGTGSVTTAGSAAIGPDRAGGDDDPGGGGGGPGGSDGPGTTTPPTDQTAPTSPSPTAGTGPVACAGVAALDPVRPSTVERVAELLAEVRALATDTVNPRASDARLLELVPQARGIGVELARDGRALTGLVPDLDAGVGADAAAAGGAEALLGDRLAAVDRIDDLVLAAQTPAADPAAASVRRAAVVDWAATSCSTPNAG